MTDAEKQRTNQEIAAALIREGLGAYVFGAEPMPAPTRARRLVPHDFTKAEYLFPALEAWCIKNARGWTLSRYRLPTTEKDKRFTAQISNPGYEDYWSTGHQPVEALRNAFAAALGVGE